MRTFWVSVCVRVGVCVCVSATGRLVQFSVCLCMCVGGAYVGIICSLCFWQTALMMGKVYETSRREGGRIGKGGDATNTLSVYGRGNNACMRMRRYDNCQEPHTGILHARVGTARICGSLVIAGVRVRLIIW